jgi:nucleotide-binding universal stress UspA family protein
MTSPETTSPKLILAPIDFSDFSRNALDVAADLASRLAAELLLVHVVPAIPDLPEGVSIFEEGEYDKSLHDRAEKRLSDLAAERADKNLKVRTEIGTADEVGMELVRIAKNDHIDMIVIATHGMTGWRRIPFGSVAKKVVEEGECPVLVLRAQETGQSLTLRPTQVLPAPSLDGVSSLRAFWGENAGCSGRLSQK